MSCLRGLTVVAILGLAAAYANCGDLFLVPDPLLCELGDAAVVHDYGDASLVVLADPSIEDPQLASRIHQLPEADRLGFRSWTTDLAATPGPADPGPGFVVLALVGPPDQRWLDGIGALGIRVVAPAHPFSLVVDATPEQLNEARTLHTSTGVPVISAWLPLPVEARAHRSLLEATASTAADDPVAVRLWSFAGADKDAERSNRLVSPRAALELLRTDASIHYVEPAFPIVLHNNLVPGPALLDVQKVWEELDFNGEGVVVNHNDTGVDLGHPDFQPGVIVANYGSMLYTDTGHGTHTAGSLAGRGAVSSPPNTFACGDQLPPLSTVRGMAWGAQLAVNNIMVGGHSEVPPMMQWAAQQGARVSSNSWGHGGPAPAVQYSSAAAEVDAAVRDADAETAGRQELLIFFSAGNSGPAPSTVSAPATAKNAVTVGASQNLRCGSWVPGFEDGPDADVVISTSGRGPSQGRIKPDLVAPGADVLSAQSSDVEATAPWDQGWTGELYALGTGTSMSCPLAAGAGTVFTEFYWRTTGRWPSPAVVKAALINGATDLGLPLEVQGWGRVDLARSIAGPEGGEITFVDQTETAGLTTGQSWQHEVHVFSTTVPLRITLVWSDVPGEADAEHPLVNDLDLVVTAPNGTVYRGNRFIDRWSTPNPGADGDRDNPVENVFVEAPEIGQWLVEVTAVNVPAPLPGLDGQDFALVYSGDAAHCIAPPPPTGLSAFAADHNRIDLGWSPVTDAVEYTVHRATTPGGLPYEQLANVAAPATTWTDTGVSGGITYYYALRSFTDCWSDYSSEASVTATGACQLAPTFAGVLTVADTQTVSCGLQLRWDPAEAPCGGPVSYEIHRSEESDFAPGESTLINPAVATTTFTDSGLENGRTYYYLVRATDTGNGFTETNHHIVGGTPSGPDLVYLEDDGEAGSDGWWTVPGSGGDPGTTPFALVGGISHSPAHAWFCADESRAKDQVLRSRSLLRVPEGMPMVLEFWHRFVFEAGWDGARLEYSADGGRSWHDVLSGDGFAIAGNPQRFVNGGYTDTLSSGGSNPLAGGPGWTGRSQGWLRTVLDLADFAGWEILLRWRLGCNQSNSVDGGWWVDDIRIFDATTCRSCAAPPPPAGLSAEARTDGVLLSWQAVTDADEYQVNRADHSEGPYELIQVNDGDVVEYLDAGASGGSTYHYMVKVCTDCLSGPSEIVAITAQGACALPPIFWGVDEVQDRGETSCALDLQWRWAIPGCPSTSVGYHIYRGSETTFVPGPDTLIATLAPTQTYRDTTAPQGETSTYIVRAVDFRSGTEDSNLRALPGLPTGREIGLFSDDMENGESGWSTAVGSGADSGTTPWLWSQTGSSSGDSSWFCADEPMVKDQVLSLDQLIELPVGERAVLEFRHDFDLEPLWDGGVLEYSTDNGVSWHDILAGDGHTVAANPERFLAGTYSATLMVGTASNPLAGRPAWTGDLVNWGQVRVDLGDMAGLAVQLRWRLGCDDSRADTGWWVDDVKLAYVKDCKPRVPTAPRHGGGTP